MAPSASTLRQAYPPRGLRLQDAARYVGIGQSKFLLLVDDGRMPKPKRIDGCVVWDRQALDNSFDAIAGDEDQANPWDAVA